MMASEYFNGFELCAHSSVQISAVALTVFTKMKYIESCSKTHKGVPPGTYKWISHKHSVWFANPDTAKAVHELLAEKITEYELEHRNRRALKKQAQIAAGIDLTPQPTIVEEQLKIDSGAELQPKQPEQLDMFSSLSEKEKQLAFSADLVNAMQAEANAAELKLDATDRVVNDVLDIIERIERYGVSNKRLFVEDYMRNV